MAEKLPVPRDGFLPKESDFFTFITNTPPFPDRYIITASDWSNCPDLDNYARNGLVSAKSSLAPYFFSLDLATSTFQHNTKATIATFTALEPLYFSTAIVAGIGRRSW
jgi:hypothetical protein